MTENSCGGNFQWKHPHASWTPSQKVRPHIEQPTSRKLVCLRSLCGADEQILSTIVFVCGFCVWFAFKRSEQLLAQLCAIGWFLIVRGNVEMPRVCFQSTFSKWLTFTMVGWLAENRWKWLFYTFCAHISTTRVPRNVDSSDDAMTFNQSAIQHWSEAQRSPVMFVPQWFIVFVRTGGISWPDFASQLVDTFLVSLSARHVTWQLGLWCANQICGCNQDCVFSMVLRFYSKWCWHWTNVSAPTFRSSIEKWC